jgi:hypothetical protein
MSDSTPEATPLAASHFIAEPITVEFDEAPLLEKDPHCPNRFVWRDRAFSVTELVSEWHSYERHNKMAENMRPAHLRAASRRGSWGVGRSCFRVRTTDGRVFDLYYDRSPSAGDRKGGWFLYREWSRVDATSPDAVRPQNDAGCRQAAPRTRTPRR